MMSELTKCPVRSCVSENIHIQYTQVNQNEENWMVDHRGIHSLGKELRLDRGGQLQDHYRRGSVVTLGMWCEMGHIFDVKYSFHEGATVIDVEITGEYDVDWPDELWRD